MRWSTYSPVALIARRQRRAKAFVEPKGFVRDFKISGGRVYLRKTGNSAALDARLLREVATWLAFTGLVGLRGLAVRARRRGPRLVFVPDVPHARYMVRAAATWAGMRGTNDPATADAAFYFDDATIAAPPPPPAQRHFNFGCGDISKSRVAQVFEASFGYPLTIDPLSWRGPAVAKSETNGAHDGHIVDCPCLPVPGLVYQRLVDTVAADGFAEDLRVSCVGGVVINVVVKRRAVAVRFLPPNATAVAADPATIFSDAERAGIARFCVAMSADWCGLDILRDRHDGRIYIVDLNKTDAGPVIALPLRDKLASTARLAAALRALVDPVAA